jgi:hypothetical protein
VGGDYSDDRRRARRQLAAPQSRSRQQPALAMDQITTANVASLNLFDELKRTALPKR